mgnify:CR=1 FL=1
MLKGFKIALRGFLNDSYGKFYLFSFLACLIGSLILPRVNLPLFQVIGLLMLILFIYATIRYALHKGCSIWVALIIAFIIFIPCGTWINFFSLVNVTFRKENDSISS